MGASNGGGGIAASRRMRWSVDRVGAGAVGADTRGVLPACALRRPCLAARSSPPGCGCQRQVYDLFDLGEFDQRGAVRTKYGTKEELLAGVAAAHAAGLRVYADVVLNHRLGADAAQRVTATPYTDADRTVQAGPPRKVLAYTKFTCPGRGGRYSDFVWNAHAFGSVDYDGRRGAARGAKRVYLIDGHAFSPRVSTERGNYDFLLGADVDTSRPPVAAELVRWGHWLNETTGVDGYRLDAVKHMDADWYGATWLPAMRAAAASPLRLGTPGGGAPPPLFAVGEYWSGDVDVLTAYLHATHHSMALFDVPLHARFAAAGRCHPHHGRRGHRRAGGAAATPPPADLAALFDGTLVAAAPAHAVTFVENHDTVAGQSLASPVARWFKPLAYAAVLLRAGGLPCVFLADWAGGGGLPALGGDGVLGVLLRLRRAHAYGVQVDYFGDGGGVGGGSTRDDGGGGGGGRGGGGGCGGGGEDGRDGGAAGVAAACPGVAAGGEAAAAGAGAPTSGARAGGGGGATDGVDGDGGAAGDGDDGGAVRDGGDDRAAGSSDDGGSAGGNLDDADDGGPASLPGGRHLIGWTRDGGARGRALAVVLSSGAGGRRRMRAAAGATFRDAMATAAPPVVVGADGWAAFPVAPRSVSVWLQDA